MLNFKKINIKDRELFIKLSSGIKCQNSEFSFANIFIWQKAYDMKLCIENNVIYISSTIPQTGEYVHFQPLCPDKDKLDEVILNIKEDIKNNNGKFCIASANDRFTEIIKNKFPHLIINEIPDMYDYVYLTSDLAELAGKKYHKKRTHINKFNNKYDYEYKKIDKDNAHHCIEITDNWIETIGSDADDEKSAVKFALEYMKELGLFGAIIYIENRPVAFTIGEGMNDNMALIHLEKAVYEYRNVYPIINQEFAKRELFGKYKYINREEDMGIEGIRRAKKSYYPAFMVKKYDIYEK